MDEEILRKEFEEWCKLEKIPRDKLPSGPYQFLSTSLAWNGWLESARRADKRARLECVEIVRGERIANECDCESDDAYNFALAHAEQAIRATIPDE